MGQPVTNCCAPPACAHPHPPRRTVHQIGATPQAWPRARQGVARELHGVHAQVAHQLRRRALQPDRLAARPGPLARRRVHRQLRLQVRGRGLPAVACSPPARLHQARARAGVHRDDGLQVRGRGHACARLARGGAGPGALRRALVPQRRPRLRAGAWWRRAGTASRAAAASLAQQCAGQVCYVAQASSQL